MIDSLITDHGVPEEEIVRESGHCMHPTFLQHQLDSSLKRLNLDCLDVFYLQNPYEGQGPFNTDNVFFDRLTKAFEWCEKQVQDGKIKSYGLTTYSCFRVKPSESKMHLSVQKVHKVAEEVGGSKAHSFKYL